MPRTMLRYAIEHYSEPERQKFLMAKVNKSGIQKEHGSGGGRNGR
jgi:hypothetical protein